MQTPAASDGSGGPSPVRATRFDRAIARCAVALASALALCLALPGCASLQERDKPSSVALIAGPGTHLARLVPPDLHDQHLSGFRALPFSAWSMDARVTLARQAQSTLDVQYYLFQNDATGRALMRELRDAAKRGVRVRILVDDLYTSSSSEPLQDVSAYPMSR